MEQEAQQAYREAEPFIELAVALILRLTHPAWTDANVFDAASKFLAEFRRRENLPVK